MTIETEIQEAIKRAIAKEVEDELAFVKTRIEERVRGQVGVITAKVLSHFEVMRHRDSLVITVNFEGVK